MAREITEATRAKMAEKQADEARRLQECFDRRFICGDWCVYDGDGLNFYLCPETGSRDSRTVGYYSTFAGAVEHGLLPRLERSGDKRTAEAVVKGYREIREMILLSLGEQSRRYGIVLPSEG